MTPEEKRDRLLKRILPALVITVIYFVFVSDFITEEKTKAEDEYVQLNQKGISKAALSGMDSQIQRSDKERSDLQKKQQDLQGKVQQMAGFIAADQSNIEVSAQLAVILANNHLRVINEDTQTLQVKDLSRSVQEIKKWLQPGDSINAEHLQLRGRYLSMYHALKSIKDAKLSALPVIFNMNMPDDGAIDNELQWELVLWM